MSIAIDTARTHRLTDWCWSTFGMETIPTLSSLAQQTLSPVDRHTLKALSQSLGSLRNTVRPDHWHTPIVDRLSDPRCKSKNISTLSVGNPDWFPLRPPLPRRGMLAKWNQKCNLSDGNRACTRTVSHLGELCAAPFVVTRRYLGNRQLAYTIQIYKLYVYDTYCEGVKLDAATAVQALPFRF